MTTPTGTLSQLDEMPLPQITVCTTNVVVESQASKSIYDLLHEKPTNWAAIKKRAETDKSSVPKDFIAQLYISAAPGPSLEYFEWFMLKFGATAGYHGFGVPAEDVLADSSRKFLIPHITRQIDISLCDRLCGRGQSLFEQLTSVVAAKAILEAFLPEVASIRGDALSYIFECSWEYDQDDDSTKAHRQNLFETCLQTYSSYVVHSKPPKNPNFLNDDGTLCLGHALFNIILYQVVETAVSFSSEKLIQRLKFLKTRDPNVLIQQNTDRQTLLDLVLSIHDGAFAVMLDDEEEEGTTTTTAEVRFKIIKFLLAENPELACIHNDSDALPIQIVLSRFTDTYADAVVSLLCEASPRMVEMRCLRSGLYPFQLAAISARKPPVCSCYRCSVSLFASSGISVSSVYTLLRRSPHLLQKGSAGKQGASPLEEQDKTKSLSDDVFIECAKEELQLARKRLEVHRFKKELMAEESNIATKKRRLLCDTLVKDLEEARQDILDKMCESSEPEHCSSDDDE